MRLEVTRRAELAVRALRVLADAGGRVKGPVLADELGTSAGFTAQVVGPLVKAGWVRSEPGPSGGYVLATDLDAVRVLDVIEAIDGPTDTGRCVVVDRPCGAAGSERCVLHDAWTVARAELLRALGDVSVAHLAPIGGP